MRFKAVEIRDRATCIPALAIFLHGDSERRRAILRRAGFSMEHPSVMLIHLGYPHRSKLVPEDWGDRTMQAAHRHIYQTFDKLEDGAVISVPTILGEIEHDMESDL